MPPALSKRLSMGGIGLGLMLVAEFTLVSWVRAPRVENTWRHGTPWLGQSITSCLVCSP